MAAATLAGCASSQPQSSASTEVVQGSSDTLSLADTSPITADRATLHVEGLSCPACATNVDHQLADLKGVHSVDVNLGDGTVNLVLGGPNRPSRAMLAQAIHDSGFTLRRIDVP